jgi:hypothetical protein
MLSSVPGFLIFGEFGTNLLHWYTNTTACGFNSQ